MTVATPRMIRQLIRQRASLPKPWRVVGVALGVLLALMSCAPQSAPPAASSDTAVATSSTSSRLLTVAERFEPKWVADRPPVGGGTNSGLFLSLALFNAELAVVDDHDVEHPLLAEVLPQLNTPSWVLFPDGTMETTYTLHPNLTWHDGSPLTADDYVFALQVYRVPDLGIAGLSPIKQIQDITAKDARTIVIRWNTTYPDAATLIRGGFFAPLPKHILESVYQQDNPAALANDGYWTRDFVGAGPFRMDHWEPGSFIEGSAFDGYVKGRPKIDRVKIVFIGDPNTGLSNLLSGDVQLGGSDVVGIPQAQNLKQQWDASKGGDIVWSTSQFRSVQFQHRPEFQSTAAIQDIRVRQAMAFGLDRQTIVDDLFGGTQKVADMFVVPDSAFGRAADKTVVRYPYDPQRSQQLMADAGFTKGGDGFYSGSGGRFSPEIRVNAGADFELEATAVADAWRRVGYDMQESVNPAALSTDIATRRAFKTLYLVSGPLALYLPIDINVQTGWSNPEYDRLSAAIQVTLDPNERADQMAQMVHIFSDDLAAIAFRYQSHVWAVSSSLQNFQVGTAEETSLTYNMENWQLK